MVDIFIKIQSITYLSLIIIGNSILYNHFIKHDISRTNQYYRFYFKYVGEEIKPQFSKRSFVTIRPYWIGNMFSKYISTVFTINRSECWCETPNLLWAWVGTTVQNLLFCEEAYWQNWKVSIFNIIVFLRLLQAQQKFIRGC